MNGKAYKRHKDAIGNFNKEYVKTEIFFRKIGRKIGETEQMNLFRWLKSIVCLNWRMNRIIDKGKASASID